MREEDDLAAEEPGSKHILCPGSNAASAVSTLSMLIGSPMTLGTSVARAAVTVRPNWESSAGLPRLPGLPFPPAGKLTGVLGQFVRPSERAPRAVLSVRL